jgi:hypothetical protein
MSETNSSSSSSASSTSSTDVVSNKELVTSTSSIDDETKRKSCSHLINQAKLNETSGATTTTCEQSTKLEVVSELNKIKITQTKTSKPPVNKVKQASNGGVNGESSRSHIELQNLAQRNSTNNNDRRSFSVIVNGANVKSNAVVNLSQASNLNKNNAQSTKSLSTSKNAQNSTVKMNTTNFNTNISKSAIDVNQQHARQTSTDKS